MVIAELASVLAKARVAKSRATSLAIPREQIDKLTIADGYEIMKKTAKLLENEKGWSVAGFKVGATAKAAQDKMGLKGPFWGYIYSPAKTIAAQRGGNIPRFSIEQDLIRGVETEFAFTIKKDITPRSKPYTAEEIVLDYCDRVIPSVEVCGFRLPVDLGGLPSMLIADTGNAAVVLAGDTFSRNAADVYKDLVHSKASLYLDGVHICEGSGVDVLGSPINSLEWLAKEVCGVHGLTIPQGTFVITGATSGLRPITTSCYMHAAFSGVSKCDIHIAFRS